MMNESRSYKSLLNAPDRSDFLFGHTGFILCVQKIFLDNLGVEFIGLTGTLTNILGFLNLAEFGIDRLLVSFFTNRCKLPIVAGFRNLFLYLDMSTAK